MKIRIVNPSSPTIDPRPPCKTEKTQKEKPWVLKEAPPNNKKNKKSRCLVGIALLLGAVFAAREFGLDESLSLAGGSATDAGVVCGDLGELLEELKVGALNDSLIRRYAKKIQESAQGSSSSELISAGDKLHLALTEGTLEDIKRALDDLSQTCVGVD